MLCLTRLPRRSAFRVPDGLSLYFPSPYMYVRELLRDHKEISWTEKPVFKLFAASWLSC